MFCVRLPSMICQWKRSYKSRDRAVMMMLKTLCCLCSSDGADPFTNTETQQLSDAQAPSYHLFSAGIKSAESDGVILEQMCTRSNERHENDFAHFSRGCKHNRLKEQITRFSQKAGVLWVLAELFLVDRNVVSSGAADYFTFFQAKLCFS